MGGSVSLLPLDFAQACIDMLVIYKSDFIVIRFVLCIVAVWMGMMMLKVAFPTVTVFISVFF